jgi:pyruvate/2-oxoglutarate/acetoin dehydrogenase E1 component
MTATTMKYHQAINAALAEEMERDDSVVLFGVDVAAAGGAFAATRDLQHRFGAARVRDTPIAELTSVGAAVGAAMAGLRPVVDIQFLDFVCLAMDQLVNQAAKMRYMTGGAFQVPMTVLAMCGAGRENGPQHSQNLEAWLAHVPGLVVCMPATPADVKSLLKAAVRSDDPVVVIPNLAQWQESGEVGGADDVAELGQAAIVRSGRDLTIISVGRMRGVALQAAEMLTARGLDAEVIDVRTVSPFDADTVCGSVDRTGAAVVVHEAVTPFGVGAEIAAVIQERSFDHLDAPIARVGSPFTIIPASGVLERIRIPDASRVAAAALALRT